MTKHPLTNEKALSLFSFERLMDESQPITIEDAMRAAADWQLEQVIEYIVANDWFAEPGSRIGEIRKAMRPQQQQEDNS